MCSYSTETQYLQISLLCFNMLLKHFQRFGFNFERYGSYKVKGSKQSFESLAVCK